MVTINDLKRFKPNFDFFIGLDSDGTIFDSMNLKHNFCFIDPLVRIYKLSEIKDDVKKIWKKINLFSENRGINRYEALYIFFEELKKSNLLSHKNFAYPKLNVLNRLKKSNILLTNNNLKNLKNEIDNKIFLDIKKAIRWSSYVNEEVKIKVKNLPPISGAQSTLNYLYKHADIIVISNTPRKTLLRDWRYSNINNKVSLICGQETGNKTDILKAATFGKYDKNKILMVGDSPSDYYAAKNNQVYFYPIIPNYEKSSWNFLLDEGLSSFFSNKYNRIAEKKKILEFESAIDAKLLH